MMNDCSYTSIINEAVSKINHSHSISFINEQKFSTKDQGEQKGKQGFLSIEKGPDVKPVLFLFIPL